MRISINWLKELVDLKVSIEELVKLLPLRTIGTKEVTDQYIELDMKGYNRADLLSLRGTALEIAAISDSQVNFQDPQDYIWTNKQLPQVKVEVQDSNLSPVYCIAKIENLKVEPSTDEIAQKLNDSGIRSINNIADVTNLVMLEYGQPLHSFDADLVKDETLIVKTAKVDEEIVTLDGKTRKLATSDLLITDPEKAVGIAGVMGGQNSEITSSSKTILLEAAIFDPVSIRKTATRLGLQSEASKRFQHGLTKKRLLQALDAAIKMYEGLGGKLTAITLVGNLKDEEKIIKLTQDKLNSLIGVEIPSAEVESSLKKLGFVPASQGQTLRSWEVTVPYWRLDINIEEDAVEELARMYGYEKIPAKELTGDIPNIAEKPLFKAIEALKQALFQAGLTEVQTYSYYSSTILENLSLDKNKLIKLSNPISSESEYLRDSLWPNLLEAVAKNIRNGVKDVAIFEIGKAYLIKDGLTEEPHRLAIALSNGTNDPISELYQIIQQVTKNLGWEIEVEKEEAGEYEKKYFHPTRFSSLYLKGRNIGGIAEIHPRIVNKFGTDQRVAVIEIEITLPL